MDTLPSIIYITSEGHSGSTLLDLMISAHSRVVTVGEIKRLNPTARKRCGCHIKPFWSCPFWQEVDRWLREHRGLMLDRLDTSSRDSGEFAAHNEAVFAAVAAVSGCAFIVDSSKLLDRLMRLREFTALNIKIVQLERELLGVVNSGLHKGRSLRAVAREHGASVCRSRLELARLDRVKVNYRDLATKCEPTLRAVMEHCGLDFQPQQLRWADHVRHSVGGNSIRFSTDSAIRYDASWERNLTPRQRLIARTEACLGAMRTRCSVLIRRKSPRQQSPQSRATAAREHAVVSGKDSA